MPEPQDRDTVTRGDSVSPERFAQVRAIFEAAVERPAAERRAYAAGACAGDSALLREVEAMLAADQVLDGSGAPSSAPEEGRFPAGTVLAVRYRILGLLGHGGMGEVYKAFDLILNQTVALKFLAAKNLGEAALVRFRNEVRIARQVSHPNVCRVYDLGMVEGLHFLSMEYIDGEDLASLLRRIGRLPQDKAMEFTRKICAGLSAAHERGVLHRDLKPANIMIDGRGQPRLTDFGLAGLAAEIPLSDLRSGTPAYMSPEQKAGKEVTTRSDIYSLGLVLHEMFTGKARKDTRSSPSEIVKDLDPAIERLILRCLEEDPKRRPQTALNVAMALPGADPIAAALAAGETPSPEMVAASQEKEGFSLRAAWLCFALVAVLTLISPWSIGRSRLLTKSPLDLGPEALTDRAQQLLARLGYTDRPVGIASGFELIRPALANQVLLKPQAERDVLAMTNRPAIVAFWYRQHQGFLVPSAETLGGTNLLRVTSTLPANDTPGMIRLHTDAQGLLLDLEVRPESRTPADPEGINPPRSMDWNVLLTAAGLDPARFHAVPPTLTPPMAYDERAGFEGSYAEGQSGRVVVEAAALRGRPVFFSEIGGFDQFVTLASASMSSFTLTLLLVLAGTVLFGALGLAWYHWRLGRGDRAGTARIFSVALVLSLTGYLLGMSHVPNAAEFNNALEALIFSLFYGTLAGALYLSVEPLVRRNWPNALISWNRLLAGRVKDPLVATHVLAGFAIGLLVVSLQSPFRPNWGNASLLDGVPSALGRMLLGQAVATPLLMFGFVLIVVLVRLLMAPLTRGRVWIPDLLVTITVAAIGGSPLGIASNLVTFGLSLYIIRRFGVLAGLAALATQGWAIFLPFVLRPWAVSLTVITLGVQLGAAVWALWVILSAQRRPSTESTA